MFTKTVFPSFQIFFVTQARQVHTEMPVEYPDAVTKRAVFPRMLNFKSHQRARCFPSLLRRTPGTQVAATLVNCVFTAGIRGHGNPGLMTAQTCLSNDFFQDDDIE